MMDRGCWSCVLVSNDGLLAFQPEPELVEELKASMEG